MRGFYPRAHPPAPARSVGDYIYTLDRSTLHQTYQGSRGIYVVRILQPLSSFKDSGGQLCAALLSAPRIQNLALARARQIEKLHYH